MKLAIQKWLIGNQLGVLFRKRRACWIVLLSCVTYVGAFFATASKFTVRYALDDGVSVRRPAPPHHNMLEHSAVTNALGLASPITLTRNANPVDMLV